MMSRAKIHMVIAALGMIAMLALGACSKRDMPLDPVTGSEKQPIAMTTTPTPTFWMVEDFENPKANKSIIDPTNTSEYVNYMGGVNLTDYGPKRPPTKSGVLQPSIFPYPNLEREETTRYLADGTLNHCGHIWGYMGRNDNTDYFPADYPYTQAQMLFSKPVDIKKYSSHNRLTFSYYIPSPPPNKEKNFYRIEIISSVITDYNHYGFDIGNYTAMPAAWDKVKAIYGSWQTVSVYFPQELSGWNPGPQTNSASLPAMRGPYHTTLAITLWPNAQKSIMGVQVKPQNSDALNGWNYEIYFDDIYFD
jgi:hypothetical protein